MSRYDPYQDNWRRDDRDARAYDSRPYEDRYGRDERAYEDPRGGQRWDDRERAYGERDSHGGQPRYDDYDRGAYGNPPPPPRRDDYSHPQGPAYPPAQYQQPYPQHQHQQFNPQPYQHAPAPTPRSENRSGYAGHPPPPRQVNTEPPSASVVLLGIPATADDLALRNFLEDMGASIDSTTVIKDRATGLSKRFGFAKFSSVEHARAFVEPNFPVVTWRDRSGNGADDGMKVKINFSQKTGGWREDQGAGARLTEEQRKAAEAMQAPLSFYVNDGTRDIGSAPTQILLLRGLDPLTSEEDIIASLSTMIGRPGNEIREGKGVKKILMTKDRASRTSWGYAFVQFADVRLATEVLANAFNPHYYPTGYRIRKSVVAFSFCHENSFVPIYARSEWSFKGEGGQQLAYWDDKAFVNAWVPTTKGAGAIEAPAQVPVDDPGDADMDAFFSSIEAESSTTSPAPAAATDSDPPLPPAPYSLPVVPLQTASSTSSLAFAAPGGPAAISVKLATSAEEERLKTIMKARKLKDEATGAAAAAAALQADKKKGELIQTKKAAVNINKWNTKQQELKAPEPAADSSPPTPPPAATAPAVLLTTAPATATPTPAAAAPSDNFEFADPNTFVCLLCQRQFKSIPEVAKHNNLSNLHKTNLKNETTVTDARARKANSLKVPSSTAAATSSPKYVDRAAARREVHGQPDHPVHEAKRRKLAADGPPPPAPPPVQPNKNGIEDTNVGAKMLEKMGWSKGGGLGSTGTGIVAPIQASQFQQGAGLGATKGVVVGEYAASPGGYKEQLRDKARARLEETSKEK